MASETVAAGRPAEDLENGQSTGVFDRRFIGEQPSQFLSFEICQVKPREMPANWSPAKNSSQKSPQVDKGPDNAEG